MSKLIDHYKQRKEALECAMGIMAKEADSGFLELDTVMQYMELLDRIKILELCAILKQYGDRVEPRVRALAGSITKQMIKPPAIQAKCEDEKTLKMRETARLNLIRVYEATNEDDVPYMVIAKMLNPWLVYRDTFTNIPKEDIKNGRQKDTGSDEGGKRDDTGKAKRSA